MWALLFLRCGLASNRATRVHLSTEGMCGQIGCVTLPCQRRTCRDVYSHFSTGTKDYGARFGSSRFKYGNCSASSRRIVSSANQPAPTVPKPWRNLRRPHLRPFSRKKNCRSPQYPRLETLRCAPPNKTCPKGVILATNNSHIWVVLPIMCRRGTMSGPQRAQRRHGAPTVGR